MNSKSVKMLGALLALILVAPSFGVAQSKPVNVALFNPIQIFPESNSIQGLRINLIYGRNVSMLGLDWGLVNSVGSGGFTGLQLGAVNLCDANVEGLQWGWFNMGGHVSGLQLGLVNYAGSMKGLQIGLINIIKSGGFMPVFPIVNWSF